MAKESPLAAAKRLFGGKDGSEYREKLVSSVVSALKGLGEQGEDLKERLSKVSNKKLIRLSEAANVVKEKYGSRDKIAERLAVLAGQAKDNDYLEKLKSLSIPSLLDRVRSAEKNKAA